MRAIPELERAPSLRLVGYSPLERKRRKSCCVVVRPHILPASLKNGLWPVNPHLKSVICFSVFRHRYSLGWVISEERMKSAEVCLLLNHTSHISHLSSDFFQLHSPGIARLHFGQQPLARSFFTTLKPMRSMSSSPQEGQYVFSYFPIFPGRLPA